MKFIFEVLWLSNFLFFLLKDLSFFILINKVMMYINANAKNANMKRLSDLILYKWLKKLLLLRMKDFEYPIEKNTYKFWDIIKVS